MYYTGKKDTTYTIIPVSAESAPEAIDAALNTMKLVDSVTVDVKYHGVGKRRVSRLKVTVVTHQGVDRSAQCNVGERLYIVGSDVDTPVVMTEERVLDLFPRVKPHGLRAEGEQR